MDYSVFEDYSSVPKNKKVTIVDVPYVSESNQFVGEINVGNYYRGQLILGSLSSFGFHDMSDDILCFNYQDEIWVHNEAEQAFNVMVKKARIYRRGKGNPEEISKIEEELKSIYDECAEDNDDIV